MLTRARLRSQKLRHISTIGVVAVAIATLSMLSVVSAATSNKIIEYSLAELGVGNSALTINTSQIITDERNYQSSNTYLEKAVRPVSGGQVIHEAIFSELTDPHGVRFFLGATPELRAVVKLSSGRWPHNCTASACEVLAISNTAQLVPRPANIGITIVGTASVTNPEYFAGTIKPPAGTMLLISPDMTGIPHLPHFTNVHGVDAWVTQLKMKSLLGVGVDKYSAQVVGFEDQLAIDEPNMILTWPQDQISSAGDLVDQSKKKIALLGFVIASLLLSFAFLSSTRFRRNDQHFRAALSRIGTPKRVLLWELFLETAIPIACALSIASILSLAIWKTLANIGYETPIHVLYAGGWRYLLVTVSCVALCTAMSTFKERSYHRASALSLIIAIISFSGFLWISQERELKFLGLPFAYALIPALFSIGICALMVRLMKNKLPPTFIILKEYLPIWRGITGMVALACILLSAALSLDSGINVDVSTESHNQVPLDVDIRTGSDLVKPLDLASAETFSSLVQGSKAYPVLRTGASINGTGAVADSVSLVGVPLQALPSVNRTLNTYLVKEDAQLKPADLEINVGAGKKLTVTFSGIPPVADILVWFSTPTGVRMSEIFGAGIDSRSMLLSGVIPPGSSLIALEIQENSNYLSRRLHANGEGDYSVPLIKGIGNITGISIDGKPTSFDPSAWGASHFKFILDGNSVVITATKLARIPDVIADDETAALSHDGKLLLNLGGNNYVQVHVAKSLKAFPGAGDRFIVMDLPEMQDLIGAKDPGATTPIELWVSTPHPAQYMQQLQSPKFSELQSVSRVALASELRSNPSRSGLVVSYRIAFGFALLLALLVFITSLPLIYREGSLVFNYLEGNGTKPNRIKAAIRIPAILAIICGEIIGGGIGVGISLRYISSSIPVFNLLIINLAFLAVSTAASLALTSRYFREENLVLR